ncbi:MAG: YCF48-related protein [bacterium]|nr:YCF48-related protein [bacterium]
MKHIILMIAVIILFLITGTDTFSQGFNSVSTPDGVNVIAAGNAGKIYRSTNGGNTWASYNQGAVDFKSVTSYDNNVWIAGSDGKVYKTLKTVSIINPIETGTTGSINSICFINNDIGYLCGDGGIVYKTINGGMNWSPSNAGISNVKLNSISFADLQNGIAAGNNGTLFITGDAGQTWNLEVTGTTRNLLKSKYFSDGMAVTGEYGVLLTKQTSSPWMSVNTRISTDITGITGQDVNNIHVCGGGGFIRNNKNGSSKFLNFETNPMLANLVDIFYYDNDIAFAVSSLNYAIIRTTNSGQSWELPSGTNVVFQWQTKLSSASGIGNNLCIHPNDRNAMFVAYGSKVFVSRDRGNTWLQIATMTGTGITNGRAHSFYVSPVDTNIWMAAIDNVSTDKVVRSSDYGVTWSIVHQQNFSAYGQPLEMDQNDPNTYYFVPDGGGFWKSVNNGLTFTQISSYAFLSPCDIIVMWDSSNVLYIGESSPSRVYKSSNSGVNWQIVLTSTGSEIPSMSNSVFDKSIAYATTFSTLLWKSSNHGNNWSNILSQPGSGWGSDLCREDPGVYLYGTYSGSTAYLTTNSGASFGTSSITGSGAGAGIIVPERGYMLAQQTSGLQKLNITYTVLTSANENVISLIAPEKYDLRQNYPNPFNPSTSIKFDLPYSANVSLKVYNQLGKEVQVLADGFRNAGSYEINFDASQLSSGVYFYKLVSADISLTKKMMLIK